MRIICFGDSNTYGYDPRSYLGDRYSKKVRWVEVLSQMTGWEVENEGMNGREIPVRESTVFRTADVLIVMLGTNDLLQGCSAAVVYERMDKFLNRLLFGGMIVLISPPSMVYGEWIQDPRLIDESKELSHYYQSCAERNHVFFVDAEEWNISMSYDGVHFSEEGHITFARALHHYLCDIISDEKGK